MLLRRPVSASVLALTALLTSGCGGVDASTAPTNATEVDFCMAWLQQAIDAQALVTESVQAHEMPTGEEIVGVLDGWIPEMLAVGTPSSMPDDARAWFETYLEVEVDPDDFDPEDFEGDFDPTEAMDDLSTEEFNQSRALTTYLQSTCNPLWRERGFL